MTSKQIKHMVEIGWFGKRIEITHTQARAAATFIKNMQKEAGSDYTIYIVTDDIIMFSTECKGMTYDEIINALYGEKSWLVVKQQFV